MARSDADIDRARAARLPDDDVVGVLLEQHARIRDLFAEVRTRSGEHKQRAFDELRALLAVHETAEEMVVRPVTTKVDRAVASARDDEEKKTGRVLKSLELLDVHSPAFASVLTELERAVTSHAAHEEREEFPRVRGARSEAELATMGRRLRAAESIAATHPHPSITGSTAAQWTMGPIASILDRVRDAVH